jgi:hypothetical protein
MGTLYDELLLDEEAPLGDYYLELQDPEHELYAGTSFQVAEYKTPEFQVTVRPTAMPTSTASGPGQRRGELLLWRAGGQRRRSAGAC